MNKRGLICRAQEMQDKIESKRALRQQQIKKNSYNNVKPFGEWRIPIVILISSSIIFVCLTMTFGVKINRNTGEAVMTMEMNDSDMDSWSYDPMVIVWGEFWRYWCILGYFGSLGIFSLFWFEYMKWKWKQIPIEYRYIEKKKNI